SLIGERQKGHVYYRCHTSDCATKSIREESIENRVAAALQPLQFSADEREYLYKRFMSIRGQLQVESAQQKEALGLRLGKVTERVARVTDAYVDGDLEKRLFDERKVTLLEERQSIEDRLAGWDTKSRQAPDRLATFLELAGNAYLSYKTGDSEEKRALLQ